MSGCVMFCYMINKQLFLWPQRLPHRKQLKSASDCGKRSVHVHTQEMRLKYGITIGEILHLAVTHIRHVSNSQLTSPPLLPRFLQHGQGSRSLYCIFSSPAVYVFL